MLRVGPGAAGGAGGRGAMLRIGPGAADGCRGAMRRIGPATGATSRCRSGRSMSHILRGAYLAQLLLELGTARDPLCSAPMHTRNFLR